MLDVIVSNVTSNNLTLLLGGASGPAVTVRTLGVGRHPPQVATGDFDREGRMDVAVENSQDDDVAIWLNR